MCPVSARRSGDRSTAPQPDGGPPPSKPYTPCGIMHKYLMYRTRSLNPHRVSGIMELIKGTLDILVLKTLSWGPMHGYGISRWIRDTSDDELTVEDGALYPALRRLEKKGWLAAEWGETETGREARFYTLTETGREQLRAEVSTWQRYVAAMARVLEPRAPAAG